MNRHLVRRHATEGHVKGVKQLVYVASCTHCGWSLKTTSKSRRNREALAHPEEASKDN